MISTRTVCSAVCRLSFVPLLLTTAISCSSVAPTSPQTSQFITDAHTNQIAFTSDETGHRNVYVLDIDSGQRKQLTNTTDNEHVPAWSPDGKHLAFGSRNQVFLVDADGSERTQITRTPGKWEAFTPTWSPDGKHLAVASHGDIFIIPADESATNTSTWIQITHSSNNINVLPAWSPHGDQIAFVSVKKDSKDSAEVYVMQRDGSNIRRLSSDAAPYTKLAWSPDATQLAFVSTRAGNQDIYLIHADGTTEVQLTSDRAQDTSPTWSPDGQFVAFATNRAGNWDIYVVGANGANEHALLQTPANEEYPTWHP